MCVFLMTLCPIIYIDQRRERCNAYFDVLRKSLRAAPRVVVLENIRPLFKVFVEAFDIPVQYPTDASEVSLLSK